MLIQVQLARAELSRGLGLSIDVEQERKRNIEPSFPEYFHDGIHVARATRLQDRYSKSI
jgi:hypothetical protein